MKKWKRKFSFEVSITKDEIQEHIENASEMYDIIPDALTQVGGCILDGHSNYIIGSGNLIFLILIELVKYNGAIIKKSSQYYKLIETIK